MRDVDVSRFSMVPMPGIGAGWFEKYQTSVYPHDFVVVSGRRLRPPRYYDHLYEIDDPDTFDFVKSTRKQRIFLSGSRPAPSLAAQEQVARQTAALLVRPFDEELS